jgi:hypothetical protein
MKNETYPNQVSTETAIQMIRNPKTPWGKVLSEQWVTDRRADCPISLWKTILNWIGGNGWRRTEFRLLKPGDEKYDPTPYLQTTVL